MSQQAKYVEVAEELRSRIQHLPPGSRCPSVKQVAREYHIARATAERVLDRLAELGHVEQIPGSGTYVLEQQAKQLTDS